MNALVATDRRVDALEAFLKAVSVPAETKVTSYLAGGIYVRELIVAPGTLGVGKIHKKEHLNFIMRGEALVWCGGEDGFRHYKAPIVFPSPAGSRKVVYNKDELVWITFHATTETDIAAVESDLTEDHDVEPSLDLIDEIGAQGKAFMRLVRKLEGRQCLLPQ